jgi:6-pyruvoyl-tetrahydropterin synthase
MNLTLWRTYKFCAAHRIGGMGACSNLHGHNYALEVGVAADSLTKGVIIPIEDLDDLLHGIVAAFDHHTILAHTDPLADKHIDGMAKVVLYVECISTELLARELARSIQEVFAEDNVGIRLAGLRLHETDRNKVELSWS